MRFIPNYTPDELASLQLQRLQETVAHAYHHSPYYRTRLDEKGIVPEDIQSLSDLTQLPFLDKDDLSAQYPFPLLSVPQEEIVRIHASSGTTGKRKVLAYTQKDVDTWATMFARCFELAGMTVEDRLQVAVGYGLWTAGAGFQRGCECFGAMCVPLGPANADMHCEMIVDLQTTVLGATASMALLLAEELHRRNLTDQCHIKKIIMGAERHSEAMNKQIKDLMGVEDIFDIYGLTEAYGPGTSLDCTYHTGLHYWADLFIFEIIDPVTLTPVAPGEKGEIVITTLTKEAAPLIRYRTHDVSRIIPGDCPCGVSFPRHDRISGRTDDMFIYRAVNIYPSQIDEVLGHIDGVSCEYQIHLTNVEGRDHMKIFVEQSGTFELPDSLPKKVSEEIRRKLLVRAQVEIVPYQSLPRTDRKAKRVFDERET